MCLVQLYTCTDIKLLLEILAPRQTNISKILISKKEMIHLDSRQQ
jgi:hypothetical protein